MAINQRILLVAFLGLGLLICGTAWGQGDKPLSEQEIVTLVGLGIDAEAIAARIGKGGVGFEVNEQSLARLKQAGVAEALLKAVAAAGKKPAAPPADAITYDQVLQLLKLGIDEGAILKRLEKSPTVFTLDANQVAELKGAGAAQALLAAMSSQRAAPPRSSDITDLALILDCSGSMQQLTTGQETKMAVAKRVVADLVQKIPNGLNVTFVVYGHEVFGPEGEPRNCMAVKVARPLLPLDVSGKAELAQMIESLQPRGATPIALALRTAGQELAKNNSLCGVVLITDGLESCMGNPAAEAAALAANLKVTFGVNVVGFGTKPEEDAALQAIARAGRGKYYAAADAKGLADSIAAIAQEIQAQAKPPEVVDVSRRALLIKQPSTELPAMKEVFLVEAGEFNLSIYTKIASITKYEDHLGIPSSTKKYDVVWLGQAGRGVYLRRDVNLPERKVVPVQPAEILGMVKVLGTGKAQVFAMTTGDKPAGIYTPVNQVEQFGDVLVLPAGTYDVYVIRPDGGSWRTTLLEEGLQIQPGKLVQLQ